jgi:excisionase family DNA binding protein
MSAIEKQPRFLTLADVAEVLATSTAQVYALVRRGELRAIQIGGRGQWRVEAVELEAFIQRMYAQTANLAADRTDDRAADRDGSSTSTAT